MAAPTEEALLAAIDAAPYADAPRLAHADWLEAHGDTERADYIRTELHTERDIYYRWVAGLPTVHGMSWESRRGYPEAVRFRSLAAFKKGWALTAGRRVRHVAFSGLRGGAKLADEPALSAITSLELSFLEPAVVLAVLRSPHLGPLHHLAVGPSFPDDFSFLPAVAELSLTAGLRSLHYCFYSNGLPEEQITALLRGPLDRLRELRFEGWLSPEALRALWRSNVLSKLTVLELLPAGSFGPQTRAGGLEELGDGSAVPDLERFRFTYHHGVPTAGRAVAAAHRWKHLRVLDLESGGKVEDAGALALAGAAHLSRLESLNLNRTGLSDAGAIALASSPHLRSLTILSLRGNMIGRAGVAALGRTTQLPNLRRLTLAQNPAPPGFIAEVEARFRENGPPVEESPAAPAQPAPPADAPTIGTVEENALVRAIWADPYDDLARQVYADWLEEQGSTLQAKLLRVISEQRPPLTRQLQERLGEDAPGPFTLTATSEGLLRISIPVRALRLKAFRENGATWLRRHHISEVTPTGTPTDWTAFFAADWVPHVRGLTFQGHQRQAFSALAASPHLASLASLTFGSDHIYGLLADFFRAADFRGLCRLQFPKSGVPLECLQAIESAPFAPHLRQLSAQWINDEALDYLCDRAVFSSLVTLAVGSFDSGMKKLADARGLGALRNLDVAHSVLSDWVFGALAGSPLLARLQWLRVTVQRNTMPSVERLARALPANCRLGVAGELTAEKRSALTEILGDRLVPG
ncbi:MAG TPA: TIGR02996 domain-containing protein [Gemmata sp.]